MSAELATVDVERQLPAVQATPMAMLAMAVQNGADIARMEQLMQLAERWEANEARKAFVAAMADFKVEAPEILKDKQVDYATNKGGRMRYRHASIGNVTEKIVEGLARHGISHSWEPSQTGNKLKISCVLTHRGGHSTTVSLEMPIESGAGRNALQDLSATMTQLERYTLLAATGLATKDQTDSDGRGERQEKPTGTVSDPFEKSAPDESQEIAVWQEFADKWRDTLHAAGDGQTFGEIADVAGGDLILARMWATDRSNPAICAWAAGWIVRTMVKLGIIWPSGLPEAEAGALPDEFNDLNAAGLWAVAASVRKLQIAAAKGREAA